MYNVDPDNFKDGVELWAQATQLELDNPSAVGEITKLLTPVISKIPRYISANLNLLVLISRKLGFQMSETKPLHAVENC